MAAGRRRHGAGEAADGAGGQPEDEHHAAPERRPGPPRHRGRRAGRLAGARDQDHDQAQEWAQFLEFIGPPPDKSVDVYRYGWIGDYVDAINFLELWTCESGNNSTNYCNEESTSSWTRPAPPRTTTRYDLYAQIEQILLGDDGDVPIAPIYWYVLVLEAGVDRETFSEPPRPGRPPRGRGPRVARCLNGIERTVRPIPCGPVRCRVRRSVVTKFIIRRLFWTIPVILSSSS